MEGFLFSYSLNHMEDTQKEVQEVQEVQEVVAKTPEQEIEELKKQMKEMQSNGDRWVQKLLSEMKEKQSELEAYDLAMSMLDKVSDDEKELIELHKQNPKAAKVILNKYYWGITIEEFSKDKIWFEVVDVKRIKEETEKEVIARFEKEREQKEIEAEINRFVLENVPADKIDDFKKELDELIDGRELPREKIQKLMKVAQKEVWMSIDKTIISISKDTKAWKVDDKQAKIENLKKILWR